jgi:hypothetical protein
VTFDESASYAGNDIITICWGSHVRARQVSSVFYNHYSLLRTIEEIYGIGSLGGFDEDAQPFNDVVRYGRPAPPPAAEEGFAE